MSVQLQEELSRSSMTQHAVQTLQSELSDKSESPPTCTCSCSGQELDGKVLDVSTASPSPPAAHHMTLSQYVKALLEEGLYEKALSLAYDCYHDPELCEDSMFLETALVLFTNMEKLDMMWTEVKQLDSMTHVYPAAKSLSQYYKPAALLTAEMLLCKEWCGEETISLSDLRKVTTLWVNLLWAQCNHNIQTFQTKALRIGKLIVHEPTFVLTLVKIIHAEVGKHSLVICVNLCLMALQQPVKDPQNNLVNASRIDTNNSALCYLLSELLIGDTSLKQLCLLTAFTITPTKELFTDLDKLYKSGEIRVPVVPLLPSCLSCVLVHGMYSLLPSTISPLVEWKQLRGKCLKYLHSSTVLNVQLKEPNRVMTIKVFVKEMGSDDSEDEEGEKPAELATETEEFSEKAEQSPVIAHTEWELQWLSDMMSLDMTWQPHWVTNDDQPSISGSTDPATSCPQHSELSAGADLVQTQEDVPPCKVVLCNSNDTLFSHYHLLENRPKDETLIQPVEEESSASLGTALQEDHAYSLPPCCEDKQKPTEELDPKLSNAEKQDAVRTFDVVQVSSDQEHNQDVEVTWDTEDVQLASGVPVEKSLQNYDMSSCEAVFCSDKQGHKVPTTGEKGLDDLASELKCFEGPDNLDKPSVDGGDLAVHQNFLADLKDEMVDPELPVLNQPISGSIIDGHPDDLTADVNGWFHSIEQPSEASSIVGSDVTPDPVTEESMQWTAIKSLSTDGNQMVVEPNWNELRLWFSEDNNKEIAPPKPAVCCAGTSLPVFMNTITDHEANSGQGFCSLESTINRLRASLCSTDQRSCVVQLEDLQQVTKSNSPTGSQYTSHCKSIKNQCGQLNGKTDKQSLIFDQNQTSQQATKQWPLHQRSVAEAGVKLKPSTINSQSTYAQSANKCVTTRWSSNQDATSHCTTIQKPTQQQDTNHLIINQPATDQKSSQLPADGSEEKVENKTTRRRNSLNCTDNASHNKAETLLLAACTSPSNILNQQPRSNPKSEVQPESSTHSTEISSCSETVEVLIQHGEDSADLFTRTRSNTSTSSESCVLISPDVGRSNKGQSMDQSGKEKLVREKDCKMDRDRHQTGMLKPSEATSVSSGVPKAMRAGYELEKAPVQTESRHQLLDSLLSFAVQEYKQITESSTGKENMSNSGDIDTKSEINSTQGDLELTHPWSSDRFEDSKAVSSSEESNITTEEIHARILNAPEDLLSGINLLPEHRPNEVVSFHTGRFAVSNVKPYQSGACAWGKSCHSSVQTSNSVAKLAVQRNYIKKKHEVLGLENCPKLDKTRETHSDSDGSDFEVVQDVRSTWSLSGKRKKSEPYSWPQKKGEALYQREIPGGRSKEASENGSPKIAKYDQARRKTSEHCSPLKTKETSQIPEKEPMKVVVEPEVMSLLVKERKEENPKSTKNKSNSAEVAAKGKTTTSSPSHGYNLRAVNHAIKYFVAGSSTETDLSSGMSGEDTRTRMGYSLRSLAHSNAKSATRTLKRPQRTSMAMGRKPPSHRAQTRYSLQCDEYKCTRTSRNASGKKDRSLAKSPSKGRLVTTGNCISDHNNNCGNDTMGTSGSHASSNISPSSPDKKLLSPTHSKKASPKQMTDFHGRLAAVENPQLPWETKPPIRTYSSRKSLSSIL
ncbi:uncharacterized protein LOC110984216 [Acanthaster planci]|uniref:Uncharacterized protein LOC110984216 n=1 Tax=Acanthaster planci TaxID=133434 RepID=A0A8B7Z9B6_ACAPL|nr:uncharacterized protein LOC110984216 [Acanthaster planci]XP_022099864.1 uncharacterized protein LOC110984216 [Acanthaster planci]